MAAVLKKRAAAKFNEDNLKSNIPSSSVPPPPKKKFKIDVEIIDEYSNVDKFKFTEAKNKMGFSTDKLMQENLDVDKITKDLDSLNRIIPTITNSVHFPAIINTIITRLKSDAANDDSKMKALKALNLLLIHPLCDSSIYLDDVITLIHKQDSTSMKRELLSILGIIISTNHAHHSVYTTAFQGIFLLLNSSSHHSIKCQCLKLIGQHAVPSNSKTSSIQSSFSIEGEEVARGVRGSDDIHPSSHTTVSGVKKKISYKVSSSVNTLGGGGIDSSPFFDVLLNHLYDDDCRVRLVALQALLSWCERGCRLDWMRLWREVVSLLESDNENIRLVVAKIVWLIAMKNPDVCLNEQPSTITIPSINPSSSSSTPKRLVDSCFMLMCDVMNDTSAVVRCQAVKLLGTMNGVNPLLLEQAFDKKPINKTKPTNPRQGYLFQRSEWCMEDDGSVMGISGSACGAFVHAIEDEVSAVRLASIDSICELSCKNYQSSSSGASSSISSLGVPSSSSSSSLNITNHSISFMFDAANDDIGLVRLNSINSLTKINRTLSSSSSSSFTHHLTSEQLDNVLAMLKDYYKEMRHCTHNLLHTLHPSDHHHLSILITALLSNLAKYPQDMHSIWRVMRSLGTKLAPLITPLLPSLLSIHSFLDSKERPIDDPSYISILILISNTLPHHPTTIATLPPHILPHIHHLRNLYPLFIPHDWHKYSLTPSTTTTSIMSLASASTQSLTAQRLMLASVLERLGKVSLADQAYSVQLLSIVAKELRHLSNALTDLKYTCLFIHSHLLLISPLIKLLLKQQKAQEHSSARTTKHNYKTNVILPDNKITATAKTVITSDPCMKKIEARLVTMENTYVGLSNMQKVNLQLIRVVLEVLKCGSGGGDNYEKDIKVEGLITNNTNNSNNNFGLFAKGKSLIDSIHSHGIEQNPVVNSLISMLGLSNYRMLKPYNNTINNTNTNKNTFASSCIEYLLSFKGIQHFNNELDVVSAVVVEPASSDFAHTFCQSYNLSLPLVVKLMNVQDVKKVVVQTTYADGHQVIYKPPLHHFTSRNQHHHRLISSIHLSNYSSTEPTTVELRVCLMTDHQFVISTLAKNSVSLSNKNASCSTNQRVPFYHVISDVTTIVIHPSIVKDSFF